MADCENCFFLYREDLVNDASRKVAYERLKPRIKFNNDLVTKDDSPRDSVVLAQGIFEKMSYHLNKNTTWPYVYIKDPDVWGETLPDGTDMATWKYVVRKPAYKEMTAPVSDLVVPTPPTDDEQLPITDPKVELPVGGETVIQLEDLSVRPQIPGDGYVYYRFDLQTGIKYRDLELSPIPEYEDDLSDEPRYLPDQDNNDGQDDGDDEGGRGHGGRGDKDQGGKGHGKGQKDQGGDGSYGESGEENDEGDEDDYDLIWEEDEGNSICWWCHGSSPTGVVQQAWTFDLQGVDPDFVDLAEMWFSAVQPMEWLQMDWYRPMGG